MFNLLRNLPAAPSDVPVQDTFRVIEECTRAEEPYSCLGCAKSLTHSSDLKRHYKVHTGGTPFDASSVQSHLPGQVTC
jgi:uncharacterized Zn-finger protein